MWNASSSGEHRSHHRGQLWFFATRVPPGTPFTRNNFNSSIWKNIPITMCGMMIINHFKFQPHNRWRLEIDKLFHPALRPTGHAIIHACRQWRYSMLVKGPLADILLIICGLINHECIGKLSALNFMKSIKYLIINFLWTNNSELFSEQENYLSRNGNWRLLQNHHFCITVEYENHVWYPL